MRLNCQCFGLIHTTIIAMHIQLIRPCQLREPASTSSGLQSPLSRKWAKFTTLESQASAKRKGHSPFRSMTTTITQPVTIVPGSFLVASNSNAPIRTEDSCILRDEPTRGVWFAFNPGRDMHVTLSTCSIHTNVSTELTIYKAPVESPPCGDISCDFNRVYVGEACSNRLASQFALDPVDLDNQYYVYVYGRDEGTFALMFNQHRAPSNRLSESSVGPLPLDGSVSAVGSTLYAKSLYYFFVGTGRRVKVTTCTSSTTSDTELRLFREFVLNILIPRNDDPECPNPLASSFTSETVANVTYYVTVEAHVRGAFGLSVLDYPPPPNDMCETATQLLPAWL